MRTAKEITRVARRLLSVSMQDGKVNEDSVRAIIAKISSSKPRGYLKLLKTYHRLLKDELGKSRAVIESATTLDQATKTQVAADLKKKYGDQVDAEFVVNGDLIGGMKITIGSDVLDGSVAGRINRLGSSFGVKR